MACYNPMIGYRSDELTKNGKKRIKFLKKEDMVDMELASTYQSIKDKELITIPCGKCIGCRLDHSRHWADRMILELDRMKKSVFVTLTYSDEFLPCREEDVLPTGEVRYALNDRGAKLSPLVKDHMPEFMKRLRADLNYEPNLIKYFNENRQLCNDRRKDGFPQIRVRFFGCGEYGENFGRCHLHIILFGLSLDDIRYLQDNKPLKPVKRNELGQITYESEYLGKLWQKGFANVSESNYFTMGYVARYTMKKAEGNPYPQKYNLTPEFVLMSRRPGIGAYFLEDHPDTIDEVATWYVSGKEIYWPSYLVRKQHEILVPGIECLNPWRENFLQRSWYYAFDKEGEKIKKAKQDLAVDKFVHTFESDERPYYQKQEFLKFQKKCSAKKLVRGDVALS